MRAITPYEQGFLEGLIDGEGSLYISKWTNRGRVTVNRGWQPMIRLSIHSTTPELLEKAAIILKKPVRDLGHTNGVTRKRMYRIELSHNILRWLLPQVSFSIPEKERRRLLALKILDLLNLGTNRYTDNSAHDAELTLLYNDFKLGEK